MLRAHHLQGCCGGRRNQSHEAFPRSSFVLILVHPRWMAAAAQPGSRNPTSSSLKVPKVRRFSFCALLWLRLRCPSFHACEPAQVTRKTNAADLGSAMPRFVGQASRRVETANRSEAPQSHNPPPPPPPSPFPPSPPFCGKCFSPRGQECHRPPGQHGGRMLRAGAASAQPFAQRAPFSRGPWYFLLQHLDMEIPFKGCLGPLRRFATS